MRLYETFSRILLIFLVASFALAAPVAVRGMHEVRVNVVDVVEDGTGASQKRMDRGPWQQWSSNAAGASSSTANADLNNWDNQLPPGSPGQAESAGSNSNSPANPGTNSGSARPGTNSGPTSPGTNSGSASPGTNHGSESPTTSTGTSAPLGSPESETWNSNGLSLSDQWLVDDPASYPQTPQSVANPPPPPPPSSPTPSKGSNGGHPPPSPGPDVNPPPTSAVQHEAESFLDMLLKGKIRRRLSGSVAVDTAQNELQGDIDPSVYVSASSLAPPLALG